MKLTKSILFIGKTFILLCLLFDAVIASGNSGWKIGASAGFMFNRVEQERLLISQAAFNENHQAATGWEFALDIEKRLPRNFSFITRFAVNSMQIRSIHTGVSLVENQAGLEILSFGQSEDSDEFRDYYLDFDLIPKYNYYLFRDWYLDIGIGLRISNQLASYYQITSTSQKYSQIKTGIYLADSLGPIWSLGTGYRIFRRMTIRFSYENYQALYRKQTSKNEVSGGSIGRSNNIRLINQLIRLSVLWHI